MVRVGDDIVFYYLLPLDVLTIYQLSFWLEGEFEELGAVVNNDFVGKRAMNIRRHRIIHELES